MAGMGAFDELRQIAKLGAKIEKEIYEKIKLTVQNSS